MSSQKKFIADQAQTPEVSDGSSANYYLLPAGAEQLQDLIAHRDMNAQIGEIFRACYRYGRVAHSSQLRDAKKILFYAHAEVERLKRKEEEEKQEALKVQEVEAVAEGRVFDQKLVLTERQEAILRIVKNHKLQNGVGIYRAYIPHELKKLNYAVDGYHEDLEVLFFNDLISRCPDSLLS